MQLKEWRKSAGLTQKEAAQMMEVTNVTFCRWETDPEPQIRRKQVKKIYQVTGGKVTPNDLFLSDL